MKPVFILLTSSEGEDELKSHRVNVCAIASYSGDDTGVEITFTTGQIRYFVETMSDVTKKIHNVVDEME